MEVLTPSLGVFAGGGLGRGPNIYAIRVNPPPSLPPEYRGEGKSVLRFELCIVARKFNLQILLCRAVVEHFATKLRELISLPRPHEIDVDARSRDPS